MDGLSCLYPGRDNEHFLVKKFVSNDKEFSFKLSYQKWFSVILVIVILIWSLYLKNRLVLVSFLNILMGVSKLHLIYNE